MVSEAIASIVANRFESYTLPNGKTVAYIDLDKLRALRNELQKEEAETAALTGGTGSTTHGIWGDC